MAVSLLPSVFLDLNVLPSPQAMGQISFSPPGCFLGACLPCYDVDGGYPCFLVGQRKREALVSSLRMVYAQGSFKLHCPAAHFF